jgi:hypothetical protein
MSGKPNFVSEHLLKRGRELAAMFWLPSRVEPAIRAAVRAVQCRRSQSAVHFSHG